MGSISVHSSTDEPAIEPVVYRLPDLVPADLLSGTPGIWPCISPLHPLKESMTIESLDWVKSLNVMTEKKFAKFARYDIMTLTALGYRRASPLHFRLCSDYMHIVWIIDDRTDEQSSAEVELEVANIKRIFEDHTLVSPDQGVLEGVLQPWWHSIVEDLKPPPSTKNRFVREFTAYLSALCEEARDRETGRLRDREEHFELRRDASGTLPSFAVICLPFDLSDEVADHEFVKKLCIVAVDCITIANDIYSYNVEQSRGQMLVAQNFVDVVLRERQKGVQDAMDVVAASYRELFLSLLDGYNNLPTFESPEQNELLKEYVIGMMDLVEGNVEFSLRSPRYFGVKAGLEEMRSNVWVKLLPLEA